MAYCDLNFNLIQTVGGGLGRGGRALLLQKLNNFKTVQATENFKIKVVVTCTLTLTLPLHPRFGSHLFFFQNWNVSKDCILFLFLLIELLYYT